MLNGNSGDKLWRAGPERILHVDLGKLRD